jgi:hypothetical protein
LWERDWVIDGYTDFDQVPQWEEWKCDRTTATRYHLVV